MKPGALLELEVERLAAGGDGVARGPGGITVFVPLSAPGDRLRVRVVEARRRFLRAEIVDVLVPGPSRATPRCAAFGRCGGCAWQHLDYAAQLDAKRSILADALRRIGQHDLAERPVVTPSPEPYGYRARARVLERDGAVGYRARRSNDLSAVDACPVLAPELEVALQDVGRHARRDGSLREWTLSMGHDRKPRVCEVDAETPASVGPPVALLVGGDVIELSPGSFGQANGLLFETLHDRVVDAAGEGEHALELYAGAGFFTLALARHFGMVEAVESSPAGVADLRRNLEGAALRNVRVHAARTEAVVPDRVDAHPDVVVLDPPRAGVPEAVCHGIASLAPRRIVYLSCDPATLARDTARLVEAGFALVHAEGFDLFPQTPHLEALALLERV